MNKNSILMFIERVTTHKEADYLATQIQKSNKLTYLDKTELIKLTYDKVK